MFFREEVVRPLTADERALVRVELGQEDRTDGADLSATFVFGSTRHLRTQTLSAICNNTVNCNIRKICFLCEPQTTVFPFI